ncbi:MAG: hypothetical protein FGM50_03480 [Mycobacterium sp.]|nr:hypothetical protein [Mycobacterium sp.]
MQISLRSQMIAGTTALVGATAIAMTPVAPAVNLPALSTSNAAVSLAALNNPLGALLNTGLVLGNYFLNGAYTTPDANWPGSGTFTYPDGIGNVVNFIIPSFGVTTPGLIPNIIDTPFPALTALVTNWAGYAYIAGATALSVAGNIADIIWTVPATAVQVALDLLTLDINQAIADIQSAIQGVLFEAQDAVQTLIGGATTIINSVVTKGQALIQTLLSDAGNLPTVLAGQVQLLIGSVTGVFQSVVAGLSDPNPIEGVWNALVDGLLDATVPGSLPATVINLTAGAGVQFGPIVSPDPAAAPFVPSIRTVGTSLINDVADALDTPVPSAASARKVAAPAAAVAAEAAPAAEATAGDSDSAAAEATSAAPAASAAADDSAAEAPKAKASKAGAARAGR